MEIGTIIKKRRVMMKLTQEEFAAKVNVTPQAVSRWENEMSLPDITLVPRIAEVLNISCDVLLKEKAERFVNFARAGIVLDPADIMLQKDIDMLFEVRKCEMINDGHVVLHADDSEYLRSMVKGILSTKGYEVIEAKDGVECLDILLSESPDILLLDIDMPGYNGLEVLEQVKKQYPNLSVLMLSALADVKTVRETLRLGASGFVAKPFGPEDLLEHLKWI